MHDESPITVLEEAENLDDDGELSPMALEVLTSLVDRLAVRVIIDRDWTHPRIEAGGVNLAVRSGISISETMRMSSNYSQ